MAIGGPAATQHRRREAFDPFADGGRSLRPTDHGTENDRDERALAVAQPPPRAWALQEDRGTRRAPWRPPGRIRRTYTCATVLALSGLGR